MSTLRRLSVVLVSFVLLFTLVAASSPGQVGYNDVAIQIVSKNYGIPAKALKVETSSQTAYQMLGETVYEFKVVNVKTGEVYPAAINQDLNEVNVADYDLAEYNAYVANFGHIDPDLAQKMATTPAGKEIGVIIWIKDTIGAEKSSPRLEMDANAPAELDVPQVDVDAIKNAASIERAADVAIVTAPVMEHLQQMGLKPSADSFSPAVYVTMTPDVIQQVGFWEEIDMIYEDGVSEPELDVARQTIFANTVNARGFTGAGVYVGIVEVGGGIPSNNPYLPGVVRDTANTCLSSHSTGVTGIVKSTNNSYKGIAYGATVRVGGSCYGYDSQLQNAATRAHAWGADVINNSWGGLISSMVPGALDKFFDDFVINQADTIVKSAGNRAGPCAGDAKVTSPGLGYNLITVGNFDDKNTVSWTGDVMDSCSSYADPISSHNDREKPEISAPGSNINSTTTSSPWVGGIGSGTSFAAPMVTGTSALMMQRKTSLQIWPEAVKAILMVTAVHNIEGDARLSEKDGAGGIDANRADLVAMNTSNAYGRWGSMAYSCSTASPYNIPMALTAGKRTRVAIAWDQNTAYASYSSKPSADIDMQVFSPSGTPVTGSDSWDNTYEIVDFTPTVSGTYTLKIIKFNCYLTPKYLGWAWYRLP
jgi:hypothetical protein